MTTKAELLTTLSYHHGADRGVSALHLANALSVPERLVRTWVSELREEGIAIAANPKTGYFIAETAEELEECCAFLRKRALHSLTLESRMRKIPLPDLIGQLRLPT